MNDSVKHPAHYNIEGRKECIYEMVDLYGIEATKHFCLLNVHKYNYRHELKNGQEDLAKAERYKELYEELCRMEDDLK